MILISADVEGSMNKILPHEQNLIPVALKRKLVYEGYYMREIIDKNKLKIYFDWLKQNNAQYIDTIFDDDLIDEFCETSRQRAEEIDKLTPFRVEPEDEIMKEPIDEVPLSKQYPTIMCDKYEQEIEDNTYMNKLANQIIEYEIKRNVSNDEYSDEEDVLLSEESDDEIIPTKKKKEESCISVAPAEEGNFQSFDDLYLEEKCFPDIFFGGKKGFLSSMAKSEHKIGFAAYCRARIRGLDPRFRENLFYIIFLFLTKEKIEIKRSIQTFCRQARKLDGLTRPQIEEIGMENLTRFNRKYSVFKNIRGTAMYFQDMKKNAMAVLRQFGAPTIFFTLSFAEFNSDPLFHQILETILNKTISMDELKQMNFSATERSKIITENVVLTTIAFERRLQKVLTYLTNEGFTGHITGRKYYVKDFIYRIEFQMVRIVTYHMWIFRGPTSGRATSGIRSVCLFLCLSVCFWTSNLNS